MKLVLKSSALHKALNLKYHAIKNLVNVVALYFQLPRTFHYG